MKTTTRGKLVIGIILIGLFLGMNSIINASQPNLEEKTTNITVYSGDTLDQIAIKLSNDKVDYRKVVYNIKQDNKEVFEGRKDSAIFPGDKLVVRYYVEKTK